MKLPENSQSIWIATTDRTNYPSLLEDIESDVVVIGGGITGLNTAYFLKKQGLKVVLIEKNKIINGTSGYTTAKITSLHELRYDFLSKSFGKESAKLYADSNQRAISEFENIIEKENIKCDFYPGKSYTFTRLDEDLIEIENEVLAAKDLGLPASFVDSIPHASFKIAGAVKFDHQFYFHPRKYLLSIAKIVDDEEGNIFENTEALDIKENESFCEIITPTAKIKASHVVVATNFPFFDPYRVFSRLSRLSSYVVAGRAKSFYPVGMLIGTKNKDLTFRIHIGDGGEWLIIGERHDEGNVASRSADQKFQDVLKITSENFDVKNIDYKWAASDTMPLDKVPYVGLIPNFKKIFVATGFNGWGMTLSLVSAKLLTDLILGNKNEWENLYNPKRLIEKR